MRLSIGYTTLLVGSQEDEICYLTKDRKQCEKHEGKSKDTLLKTAPKMLKSLFDAEIKHVRTLSISESYILVVTLMPLMRCPLAGLHGGQEARKIKYI